MPRRQGGFVTVSRRQRTERPRATLWHRLHALDGRLAKEHRICAAEAERAQGRFVRQALERFGDVTHRWVLAAALQFDILFDSWHRVVPGRCVQLIAQYAFPPGRRPQPIRDGGWQLVPGAAQVQRRLQMQSWFSVELWCPTTVARFSDPVTVLQEAPTDARRAVAEERKWRAAEHERILRQHRATVEQRRRVRYDPISTRVDAAETLLCHFGSMHADIVEYTAARAAAAARVHLFALQQLAAYSRWKGRTRETRFLRLLADGQCDAPTSFAARRRRGDCVLSFNDHPREVLIAGSHTGGLPATPHDLEPWLAKLRARYFRWKEQLVCQEERRRRREEDRDTDCDSSDDDSFNAPEFATFVR